MANKINYSNNTKHLGVFGGICFTLCLLTTTLYGQTEHRSLLQGTNAYKKGDYETAAKHFDKALEKNQSSVKGHFNLGNAAYKREQYDDAILRFQDAVSNAKEDKTKGQAFYNLGNSHLAKAKAGMQQQGNAPARLDKNGQEQLKKAIDAYKNALRNNTDDYDAKNNLAMAYKMLRQQQRQQQQQQQQQQNQNQQDKQNKQKPNDKENQNQQNQESPANQDKDKPVKNDNNIKSSKPQDLEKKQIDRMMKRIEEEDKKVQEKLMKRKRADSKKIEKDW